MIAKSLARGKTRMKAGIGVICFCLLIGGCAIGQDLYDNRRIDECRELPTPNERLDCERDARDQSTANTAGRSR